MVGGFEEQAGGPWSGAAASDVEGVEEASVVGCEECAGSEDAAEADGDVVGVCPVVGADEGYEECPGWFSFGGEDAVELVGAAAGIEGEAVEDAVSSCSSGAPEACVSWGRSAIGLFLSGGTAGLPLLLPWGVTGGPSLPWWGR